MVAFGLLDLVFLEASDSTEGRRERTSAGELLEASSSGIDGDRDTGGSAATFVSSLAVCSLAARAEDVLGALSSHDVAMGFLRLANILIIYHGSAEVLTRICYLDETFCAGNLGSGRCDRTRASVA